MNVLELKPKLYKTIAKIITELTLIDDPFNIEKIEFDEKNVQFLVFVDCEIGINELRIIIKACDEFNIVFAIHDRLIIRIF